VTLGWLAPVVLLPQSFFSLAEEAQCGVACHELLHVRRHDWLVTVLEELAGALLWCNPGAWMLLAQIRLAREKLVDAETVLLTAEPEPYIKALLAIAGGSPTFDLTGAPVPLFLRRRHLTQRIHALLKEASMSKFRLLSTYSSMAVLLVLAGWLAVTAFPLVGNVQAQPAVASSRLGQNLPAERPEMGLVASVPVPSDPFELVTTQAQVVSSPTERAAALGLFERAMQNAKLHMPGTPPYQIHVPFFAAGDSAYVGPGELTEMWFSGQSWRWTAKLGSFSIVRVGWQERTFEDRHITEVPSRIQMLRNAIFWAAEISPSNAQIRAAAVRWNGRPTTCLLTSRVTGSAARAQGRLWEEEEYCVDNATGAIQILSVAPGTYVVYGYGENQQFHGRLVPDQITISIAGTRVVEAQVDMSDAISVTENQLASTPQMIATDADVTLTLPVRLALISNVPSTTGTVQPVIVHAQIGPDGHVGEVELSATSDRLLVQSALDLVKRTTFPPSGNIQRQAYINVRSIPASQ
jgi:hypothetical protein